MINYLIVINEKIYNYLICIFGEYFKFEYCCVFGYNYVCFVYLVYFCVSLRFNK